jgi:hypothetical protein
MSGPDIISPTPSPSCVIERWRVGLDSLAPEMEPDAQLSGVVGGGRGAWRFHVLSI